MAQDTMTRVLAVDDEEGVRELLRRLLEPAGYLVQTAPDADRALQMVRTFQPQVVLIDVHMPGKDGLWLADQIRHVAPHTGMVLATFDADIPPTASLKPGIVEYLVKPFDRDAVIKAVEAARAWAAGAREVATPAYSAPYRESGPALGRGGWNRPGFWAIVAIAVLLIWGIFQVLP